MASNVTSTSGSTRSDMGASTVLTGVLKDVYLPGMTNTIFFDDKFTRLIQSQVAKMDATGRRFVHAFDTQRSSGVGPMAEGGDFRDSVPIDAAQGTEWLKYYNGYFQITGPAAATVKAGEGSYVNIIEKHMTSMTKSAKMDVERICMGQADGLLGKVGTGSTVTSGSTLKVDGPAFYDTQYFEPGQYIEVHTAGTFGTERTCDGSTSKMQVSSLTTGNKRTSTLGTIVIKQTMDGSSTIVAADPITRYNAYESTTCLEGNGLMNLISDGASTTSTYMGAETSSNFTSVWGKTRTTSGNEYLISQIVNVGAELYEDNLLEVIIENENQYQGTPNLLIVTPRAMLKYFGNTKDDRRFNTMSAMNWVGGYTGLGIQLGDRKYMLTAIASVPEGYAFLINTRDFAFMRPPGMTGFKWLTGNDGGVLRQKEGSDNMFAACVDYAQFVCFDPGHQCKMYGINE